ncbi:MULTISPECIES: MarR family winged helix-turn-helix transcriptional regulator [unclassified Streptomyces]|uniref:MarR family winged helix-turn-helix transcriptional regulator n=1 Tax=unclassified Streptomyces TaxID=2593676 RepID=UPI0028C4A958|nr:MULTISPECIES: MarR family transcriptional regulator [unclassified Streptomyces]WNO70839.1 MarR family transcriptional regulator [Streptomyces sp. AM8-1-1]
MTDFDPADADLSLLSLFAGWGLADELQRRLAADGFEDSRFADGVVFQHLIERPLAIGAIAERLGVTQQAASKSVADLERRDYLLRRPDPGDARARLVDLTDRGRGVITAARMHRAAIEGEVIAALGAERVEAARLLLADVLTHLGADAPLRMRRAKPPR